jgi:hypothetical protein
MRWVRDFLERPIADHDRPRAFAVAATVLLIAAVALSVTADSADRPASAPSDRQPITSATLRTEPGDEPPAAVLDVARRFLGGYLDHIYGRGRAGEIRGATDRLRDELADQPVRRSPAMRRQRPRVERIDAQRLPGGWRVEAEIATATISFPIAVVVAARPGGPLVTRLVED